MISQKYLCYSFIWRNLKRRRILTSSDLNTFYSTFSFSAQLIPFTTAFSLPNVEISIEAILPLLLFCICHITSNCCTKEAALKLYTCLFIRIANAMKHWTCFASFTGFKIIQKRGQYIYRQLLEPCTGSYLLIV